MPIRILHTSDLHGRYKPLLKALALDNYDLWIDSGDFLPNTARGHGTFEAIQRRHQLRWLSFKNLGPRIASALAGRPAIMVPGNHDFVDAGMAFRAAHASVHTLLAGRSVELHGARFAGFREVEWSTGKWAGERHADAFPSIIQATLENAPEVLVTHSPPKGVLDGVVAMERGAQREFVHIGIPELADAVLASPVRVHFFGHVHECGGETYEEQGVAFHNGATNLRLHLLRD